MYFAHCQFGFCQLLWIVGVGAGRWQWMTDPDIILHLSIAQPPVPITALKSIALRALLHDLDSALYKRESANIIGAKST